MGQLAAFLRLNLQFFLMAAAFGTLLPTAHAVPMVDQQHVLTQSTGGVSTFSNYFLAQSFTVGQAGLLSQVDLTLGYAGNTSSDVSVALHELVGGVPADGAPLYQTLVPLSEIPFRGSGSSFEMVEVDVSAANLNVSPNEQYAIVVTRDGPSGTTNSVFWEGGQPGYDGGERMTRFGTQDWSVLSTNDYGFRTWVDPNLIVPEPGIGEYTLFETAKATPDNPVQNSGAGVGPNFFPAVNFTVERETKLSQVGAYLQGLGPTPGQIFAAIVETDNLFTAPDPFDLSGDNVLATTLLSVPTAGSSDVTGEVDVTLQPGTYALVLGTDKFGAAAGSTLRFDHTANGSWSPYSIRQSDGRRTFFSPTVRLFASAESADGTVQVRPTVDGVANVTPGFLTTLNDGAGDILVKQGNTASDADQLAVLEFSLEDVPAEREITGVSLEIDVNLTTGPGGQPIEFEVFGYAGNGELNSADAEGLVDLVGTTSVDGLGITTIEIDPSFVAGLLGEATHLGLVISPGASSNFRFNTLEAGQLGEPGLLTISLGLAGDYNGDGMVNAADYEAWRTAFGTNNAAADGNGNGIVDAADYTIWRDNLPAGTTAAAAVPEPAVAMLLAMFALGVTLKRQRLS